jgi:hypothetical protein
LIREAWCRSLTNNRSMKENKKGKMQRSKERRDEESKEGGD